MTTGTVLLIDASADRRRSLRAALERRGFQVVGEAGSVPEIVSAAADLESVPSTVMVGSTLGPQASKIAQITKRVWPKAHVIQEFGRPRRALRAVGA